MRALSNGRLADAGTSPPVVSVLAVSNARKAPPNGSPTNSAPPQSTTSVSPLRIDRNAWPIAAVPAAQATAHEVLGPCRE